MRASGTCSSRRASARGCAIGCNISPGERYGEVRRIENRYHGEINGYFLCDRGRFGYGYVNRTDRPRKPLIKLDGHLVPVEVTHAVARVRHLLASGKPVVGIGSPRASLEANYRLRALVGAAAFSSGMTRHDAELTGTVLRVLRDGCVGSATIREIGDADAVLLLGEDVLATAPLVALALRQTARGKAYEMRRAIHVPEWQSKSAADIAQHSDVSDLHRDSDGDRPRRHRAAHAAPRPRRDRATRPRGRPCARRRGALRPTPTVTVTAIALEIAAALRAAQRPLIVSGTGLGSTAIIEAAANVAWALHKSGHPGARLSLAVPEANSLGMALFDAPPLEDALERIAGREPVMVVLENDLERRVPKDVLTPLLARAHLVVLDHQMTATARHADVVLPAATFAEATGTLVNMEGRAQRYFQNFDPAYYDRSIETLEAWRWLGRVRGGAAEADNLDAVLAALEAELPQFNGVARAAPGADFRMHGMGLARASHRQSGRTAARAIVFVHEPRSTPDPDTALRFSMEGYNGAGAEDRPPELLPFAWAPGWNSPQAWNKFQTEVGGSLRGGDPGVHLFAAQPDAQSRYFEPRERPTVQQRGESARLLPLYEHFGSEELTSLSTPIRARMTDSYIVLNPDDARRLGIEDAGIARVTFAGGTIELPARTRDAFPAGAVGLPVGMPGIPPFDAGSPCSVGAGD